MRVAAGLSVDDMVTRPAQPIADKTQAKVRQAHPRAGETPRLRICGNTRRPDENLMQLDHDQSLAFKSV